MVVNVKYALSCVRRLGPNLCGISPASAIEVPGVGRIDLCARHALEVSGMVRPIEKPIDRPKYSHKPEKLIPSALEIIAYVRRHPGATQVQIAASLSMHKTTVGHWCKALVAQGYLRTEGRKSGPAPWRYEATDLRPPR